MMRLAMTIDAGETRHIRIRVRSTDDEPFVIRNPHYELVIGRTIEASGDCEIIEEHVLDVLVTPIQRNCVYRLKYIYEIADEVYVDIVEITVRN